MNDHAKPLSKILVLGDAMIPSRLFVDAVTEHLSEYIAEIEAEEWEPDWSSLQSRRLKVEAEGPEVEDLATSTESALAAEVLVGLFVPVSAKLMDTMPDLKLVGVSRAGLENVNVDAATERGIVVFNVLGRNAEAVSDFTVGLMLAESRNIARAHLSISEGKWRKEFSNSQLIPQMKGKRIGLVGFGHVGQLVAKKLAGFDVKILVHDPYAPDDALKRFQADSVSLDQLFESADFVTVHARLSEDTRGLIGERELRRMKSTAYLVNTARAGLIDHDALERVLAEGAIAGAALDVFPDEPLEASSGLRQLDNVTLTTHIAGTTTEALTNSPQLLLADIRRLFDGVEPAYIVNPNVLDHADTAKWLEAVRKAGPGTSSGSATSSI